MHLELAVFDLSCLVIGLGETCSSLLRECARGAGVSISNDDARAVLGLPVRRAVAALFQTGHDLSVAARRTEYVFDAYSADLLDRFSRQGAVRTVDGAASTFAAVRALDVRIAVTTSLPRRVAEVVLGSVDWFDRELVDVAVTCDDVDEPRPRPGMILEAMGRTAVLEESRVLTLGDTPSALVEGTLARCGAIVGATYGSHSREELILRPHTHLVDDLPSLVDIVRAPAREYPFSMDRVSLVALDVPG